jgi:hypothetical protein
VSTPISSYTVTVPGSVAVNVAAQQFSTLDGILIFYSASSQTVAAFAPGQWLTVQPVVTP